MDGNVVLLLVFLSRRLVYSVRESNQRGLTGTFASGALLVKGGETAKSYFRTVILQGELGRYGPVHIKSRYRKLFLLFLFISPVLRSNSTVHE
ncbi:hypothetical protein BDV34DRAFT_112555 [Aspergillus parasiticus]|uniref:Secreted protein n=1 Tax=Aspergillus parasiticus TaxID=5067 RepID=A0A5N6DKP3_ASPPA|nr:hypothetical protein BDV34DRAFT_112555 [Aspergillus parasiticus]